MHIRTGQYEKIRSHILSNPTNLISGFALLVGGGITAFGGLSHFVTVLLLLIGLFGIHRLQVSKVRKLSNLGLLISGLGLLFIGYTGLVMRTKPPLPALTIDARLNYLAMLLLSSSILGIGFLMFGIAMYRSKLFSALNSYLLLIGYVILIISGWPVFLGGSLLWYGFLLLTSKYATQQDRVAIEIIDN